MAGTTRLAWRNLGRNRRRTAITGLALAIGVTLSVACFGLIDGTSAALVRSLTRFELGHVQVHTRRYQATREPAELIADPTRIGEALREAGATAVSARAYGYALTSHDQRSAGLEIVGVDPRTEPGVTDLRERITAGRYLDAAPTPWPAGRPLTAEEQAEDEALTRAVEAEALGELDALIPLDGEPAGAGAASPPASPAPPPARAADSPAPGPGEAARRTRALAELQAPPPSRPPRVLLGAIAARILRVGVGDRVHVGARSVDGAMREIEVEVVGLFETGTPPIDRRMLLHLRDLQHLTGLGERVHEVAALVAEADQATAAASAASSRLGDPELLVRSWSTIRPDIEQVVASSRASTMVIIAIIFFVSALGVINTLMMSVFERTREFGVLRAIGMSRRRIFTLLVAESALLVAGASLVGVCLGLGLDLYMVHHGIDLSSSTGGLSVGGVGLEPVLHGAITAQGVIVPVVVLSIICVAASFYPALRAARMPPAIGLRET